MTFLRVLAGRVGANLILGLAVVVAHLARPEQEEIILELVSLK